MANPQTEHGHIRIANTIWDSLCKIRISGEARQVMDAVIRQTWGYSKKHDFIPLKKISDLTGLKKPDILRAFYKLIDMNLVYKTPEGKYGFNKNYDEWKPLAKKIMVFRRKSMIKEICYLCGFTKALEIHHIIPRAKGGNNKIENLVMLCPNCHALTHKGEIIESVIREKKSVIENANVSKNDNGFEQNYLEPEPKKITVTEEPKTITSYNNTYNNKTALLKFEELWELYPNKDGKKGALRHFIASVKTLKDLTDIHTALNNYKANLRKETWKHPKSGETWFNNWRDWVDWKESGRENLQAQEEFEADKKIKEKEAQQKHEEVTCEACFNKHPNCKGKLHCCDLCKIEGCKDRINCLLNPKEQK